MASATGESVGMFERVTRAMNVAYYEWHAGSDAVHAPPALSVLFGFEPDFSMQLLAEHMHPDDAPGHWAAKIAFFKSDADRGECTYRIRVPGGDYRWVRDYQVAERDASGRVFRITGAVSDITESVQREAALAAREAENHTLIDRQATSIDVLRSISASPDDPQPVFEQIARRARALCGAAYANVAEFDGTLVHMRAQDGFDADTLARIMAAWPMPPSTRNIHGRVTLGGAIVLERNAHDAAWLDDVSREAIRRLGVTALLGVPLRREGGVLGTIVIGRTDDRGFDDAQIALVESFAEQAVIAMRSAETFRELQQRTDELTRSVAELQALEEVLRAVNSSLDLETVLATIISRAVALGQADEGMIYEFDVEEQVFVPKAAFGMTGDRIARLRERRIRMGETYLGRSGALRAPVHVDEVQQDETTPEVRDVLQGIHAVLAVPLLRDDAVVGGMVIRRRREGGFGPSIVTLMQTFAGQSVLAIENARLFQDSRAARAAAEKALADLHRAQDRLVQSEKLASLGQLTAGIAHEIKNPLNFVNNFSALSCELLDELHEALAPASLAAAVRSEVDELTTMLKGNLEKIVSHGKRADAIVKNMLLHSRESSGERRGVDLNASVEEALNLAYHGARAEKPGFNITLVRRFDPSAGAVELYPQEFTRVLLNLIGNGFYAATRRKTDGAEPGFEPTLTVTTQVLPDAVMVSIRDNGIGIPDAVKARMFEPFFTTKPAGESTGLGLSLSHDIVVKQHGGSITVDSQVGAFTEFSVTLPRAEPGALP